MRSTHHRQNLLEKSLTAQQHNVCNKYLELIVRSGALGKSSGLGEGIFTSHSSVQPPPRSVVLIQITKEINRRMWLQERKDFLVYYGKEPQEYW